MDRLGFVGTSEGPEALSLAKRFLRTCADHLHVDELNCNGGNFGVRKKVEEYVRVAVRTGAQQGNF